jgi:hypothetical protein
MQRDSGTYCDEPEDGEGYEAWLEGFDLAACRPDIEALIAGNTFMSELQVGTAGTAGTAGEGHVGGCCWRGACWWVLLGATVEHVVVGCHFQWAVISGNLTVSWVLGSAGQCCSCDRHVWR